MNTIINEVILAVGTWKEVAKKIGIPNKEQQIMDKAFKTSNQKNYKKG